MENTSSTPDGLAEVWPSSAGTGDEAAAPSMVACTMIGCPPALKSPAATTSRIVNTPSEGGMQMTSASA